jgi:hypothetical protein
MRRTEKERLGETRGEDDETEAIALSAATFVFRHHNRRLSHRSYGNRRLSVAATHPGCFKVQQKSPGYPEFDSLCLSSLFFWLEDNLFRLSVWPPATQIYVSLDRHL